MKTLLHVDSRNLPDSSDFTFYFPCRNVFPDEKNGNK